MREIGEDEGAEARPEASRYRVTFMHPPERVKGSPSITISISSRALPGFSV